MDEEVLYDGTSGDPTVIWYDGGGTTGWAAMSVHPDALTDPECRAMENITFFACGEFYGNEFMQVDQMIALAEAWPGAALGVEHWVLYDSSAGRKDENLVSAVRINAAFRYGLHLRAIERECWSNNDMRLSTMFRNGVPVLLNPDGSPVKREIPLVSRQLAKFGVHDMPMAALQRSFYNGHSLESWTRGSDHKRDATRHVMTFFKRLKAQPKLRAEVFPALTGA